MELLTTYFTDCTDFRSVFQLTGIVVLGRVLFENWVVVLKKREAIEDSLDELLK